jgi:hypothetical protein
MGLSKHHIRLSGLEALIAGHYGIWENHTFIAGYALQIVAYYSSPCIIATVAYGSPMAPEVAYMRYVRDNLIGSTEIGGRLVKA